MEILDFAEAQGQRNAAFSLETLELMSKRAHALLSLLLGGAGAAGAYALGQIGKPGGAWSLGALGAVSLWWFVLAAWVALRALRTQEVRAPACDGQALVEHARALDDYIKQAKYEGESPADVLTLLREGELMTLQKTADDYRSASKSIAQALDRAYLWIAITPVGALWGLALVRYLA
ncbi:MAG TPA: hypothetical protein VIK56_15635 [Rhodoferax sp.]